MRSIRTTTRLRRSVLLTALLVGATSAATAATTSVAAPTAASTGSPLAARTWSVRVHRGGHDATIRFHRAHPGEAFLRATVSARGVSWAERRNESAVVSAYVDGHYATDIVITSSGPVQRRFALGHLTAGHHLLRLHYATRRSPSGAGVATLRGIRITTVRRSSRTYAAARYAPVLYGRDVTASGGPFQNNHTDTPLLAWHQVLPAARPGHAVIQYSVLWSNEDGGTGIYPPALMAQWGRTTDIEWVYQVEVNARGRRVPGTGAIQGANHRTKRFRGRYDGSHPLLQTCTTNNNVCEKIDDPMRFALSATGVLPAGQPREHEMDTHPWTYQVMAREMVREHKIEKPSNPSTPDVGDQRSYLYITVDRGTAPPASAAGVGLAVDVKLRGHARPYASDHRLLPTLLTVNRDGPSATTVELPVGTRKADVVSISVRRVPINTADTAPITVTRIGRAFFLRPGYRPRPSFVHWRGSHTLTVAAPTAVLWTKS